MKTNIQSKTRRASRIIALIALILFTPAFLKSQTVVDIIVNSENHTVLETAVVAAGLTETLSGEGPFTVFAPTDAAFEALPEGLLNELLADPSGQLTQILLYHVVGASAMSSSLTNGQMITTAQGNNITITITEQGAVFVNEARVTLADITATNGVVHVIDAVLVPQEEDNTVFGVIEASEDHTLLETAIVAAQLDAVLQGEGPFTVFAPTDAAFEALPEGLIDELLADPSGQLTQILLYHVVGASAMSSSLTNGQMIATVQGNDVTITITEQGDVFVNDAQVIVADIAATNGVVHVIDAVLVPQEADNTVFNIIEASEDHTLLEAALIAAELDAVLQGEGPFTVFAPTDAAFEALPEGLIDELLADPSGQLTQILLYHVVGASAMSSSLTNGQMIATVQGNDVTITITEQGDVFVNDAQVIVADIAATNGVVHVIDAVLVPQQAENTVYDIIEASENHTLLEAALIAAELDAVLQGEGPFTVFAPTDAAFEALPEGLLDQLLADPTGQLTQILLYHVVGASALSSSLSNNQTIETVFGEAVTVTINQQNEVFINQAKVTTADIVTGNGVVHVIDAVLVPQTTNTDFVFSDQSEVSIYPNPARNNITIELALQNPSSALQIEIMNITGRRIAVYNIGSRNDMLMENIDVSNLPQGVYLLNIKSENNLISRKINVVK